MINPAILNAIRQQISEGETGSAIQTFIQYLESDPLRPGFLKSLRVIQAGYHELKRKESIGVIPYSEARTEHAKVNEAVLTLLEQVASGAHYHTDQHKKWSNAGTLLVAGLVICMVIAGWWMFREKSAEQDQLFPTIECPSFKPQSKRVMVLAFQRLSGADSRPELSIQTRIQDLTEKNSLSADVRIIPQEMAEANRPGNAREGAELGRKCQADLVIWGDYEKFQDSISVDIRYAFSEESWPAGIASTTFKNVSEIKFDRMKISNFDEAVLRLCTALALHENRMDLAEKWLLKQPNPSKREQNWIEQLKKTKD